MSFSDWLYIYTYICVYVLYISMYVCMQHIQVSVFATPVLTEVLEYVSSKGDSLSSLDIISQSAVSDYAQINPYWLRMCVYMHALLLR